MCAYVCVCVCGVSYIHPVILARRPATVFIHNARRCGVDLAPPDRGSRHGRRRCERGGRPLNSAAALRSVVTAAVAVAQAGGRAGGRAIKQCRVQHRTRIRRAANKQ